MVRKIQSPGIEINEIDNSGYSQTQDYSIVDTTSLIAGVADEGEDYTIQWVNSKTTLTSLYGTPQNEAEMYFYNAGLEILNKGGICLMAKLPYDNEAKDKFNSVTYTINNQVTPIELIGIKIGDKVYTLRELKEIILKIANTVNYQCNITNIQKMRQAIDGMLNKYGEKWEYYNTLVDIKNAIQHLIDKVNKQAPYYWLHDLDSFLTSYLEIQPTTTSQKITLEQLDTLITGNKTSINNKIQIIDISRKKYDKSDETNNFVIHEINEDQTLSSSDFLGIVPVIVSPVNALFFQNCSTTQLSNANIINYDILSSITTVQHTGINFNQEQFVKSLIEPLSTSWLSSDFQPNESYSNVAASHFPAINFINSEHLDSTYLKDIGIVVFKAVADSSNKTQTKLIPLESFSGSLDSSAKDSVTKSSRFIDDIVNSNSKYIKLFSSVNSALLEKSNIILLNNQTATTLGFYEVDLEKKISFENTLIKPLNIILERASNLNAINVDLVIDAGTSTIAQLAASRGGSFTFTNKLWKISDVDHDEHTKYLDFSTSTLTAWRTILNKFDNFCKHSRRDCMFIADGLRQFCLDGNSKIVRNTSLTNTIKNAILPKLKFMQCLNSSYSAGYCNWIQTVDEYTGQYIWCPPSIKAAGVYTYTDTYHHRWDAPAGMTRGKLNNVIDCAFSPNNEEAGKIYTQAWNYAVNYPLDGVILEGQKTFQIKQTALDRVNVRRLMLYLEKSVSRVAKYFLYQGNTEYLRQRFVDTISPIFEDAVSGQGILEYVIKCDNTNNTAQTIDNNELHCQIAVKPVKTIEYILLDFVYTNQSTVINETVFNNQ